jgi:hypothetical protein
VVFRQPQGREAHLFRIRKLLDAFPQALMLLLS